MRRVSLGDENPGNPCKIQKKKEKILITWLLESGSGRFDNGKKIGQSKERGITLDLGFSSFTVDLPPHLPQDAGYDRLQFTLVDCPGHASLIKTIIGGRFNTFDSTSFDQCRL